MSLDVVGRTEFIFDLPLWVVVLDEITRLDAETGLRVLTEANPDGFCRVVLGGHSCLPFFTDEDLATCFAASQSPRLVAVGLYNREAIIAMLQDFAALHYFDSVVFDTGPAGSRSSRQCFIPVLIEYLRNPS